MARKPRTVEKFLDSLKDHDECRGNFLIDRTGHHRLMGLKVKDAKEASMRDWYNQLESDDAKAQATTDAPERGSATRRGPRDSYATRGRQDHVVKSSKEKPTAAEAAVGKVQHLRKRNTP